MATPFDLFLMAIMKFGFVTFTQIKSASREIDVSPLLYDATPLSLAT
jgi:hypothetical protein